MSTSLTSPRLLPLPDGFGATRDALHQLAYFAIAPRRYSQTGKLGLRWTPGGFGTPFYRAGEGDEQVRMETDRLVVKTGDSQRSTDVSSIREATDFLGVDYSVEWFEFHDPLDPWDPDGPLDIDTEAARRLADWFGFGTLALEHLRRTPGAEDVSLVQLWPEHFDPAVELGSVERSRRASYGASPGDREHDEPYLYVSPWSKADRSDDYWNDDAFGGASLAYSRLLEADDPLATAVAFLSEGHRLLMSG